MVIKNKDGTTYNLRGPNPLLEDQEDWNKDAVRLINLGWRSQTITDEHNPIEKAQENVVNIRDDLNLTDNPKAIRGQDFIKELTATTDVKIEKPIEKSVEVEINVDPKLARILRERGVEFYCAPAVDVKTHTDDLYGSSYETITYGEQFVFDAIVIDESDFQIQFWCVRPVTVNSIVLKKIRERGERWWRINQVETKTGGHLAICVTSDSNPDFS